MCSFIIKLLRTDTEFAVIILTRSVSEGTAFYDQFGYAQFFKTKRAPIRIEPRFRQAVPDLQNITKGD